MHWCYALKSKARCDLENSVTKNPVRVCLTRSKYNLDEQWSNQRRCLKLIASRLRFDELGLRPPQTLTLSISQVQFILYLWCGWPWLKPVSIFWSHLIPLLFSQRFNSMAAPPPPPPPGQGTGGSAPAPPRATLSVALRHPPGSLGSVSAPPPVPILDAEPAQPNRSSSLEQFRRVRFFHYCFCFTVSHQWFLDIWSQECITFIGCFWWKEQSREANLQFLIWGRPAATRSATPAPKAAAPRAAAPRTQRVRAPTSDQLNASDLYSFNLKDKLQALHESDPDQWTDPILQLLSNEDATETWHINLHNAIYGFSWLAREHMTAS